MSPRTEESYRDDLAYVHDVGFGDFARQAGSWLLKHLRAAGIRDGLVIDLGSGSGILAEALTKAGYDVLGYDISPAMIEIARRRAPAAEFRQESFLTAALPPCVAVTSIGEIFNYMFDGRNSARALDNVFGKVYRALGRDGVFLFDGAVWGRAGKTGIQNGAREGDGWACLFTAREDRRRKILTRDITTFRRVGEVYRRDFESHKLRLFDRGEILAQLRAHGFRARRVPAYGPRPFPHGYLAVVARKP